MTNISNILDAIKIRLALLKIINLRIKGFGVQGLLIRLDYYIIN